MAQPKCLRSKNITNMASSAAFLAKLPSSKSAIFRETLITETKLASLNYVASISRRSEFNSSYEMDSTKILYSTPLIKITDSCIPFTEYELEHAVKKVREIIRSSKNDRLEELIMIDSIQRLGLEHYFKDEIHAVLQRHYERFCKLEESSDDDLHEVALRFRLLRQQGYHVTALDAFNKFMDDKGNFKQELSKDRKGLISLFEASHLGIPGENILDVANEFSAHLLNTSLKSANQFDVEATIIATTLANPYLRSMPGLMAKNFLCSFEPSLKFLHNFEDKHGWANEVHDLARMYFNMAQIIHQSEITQVYKWWKDLNLTKELKLARDQPMKWHIWSLAALPNPSMKEERVELTKPISLIYLIDDIFDVYGTLEELTLFTEAVNRWELHADIEGLPNSMKMCLKALHDTTDEMSHKIYTKHGCNPKTSLQKAWADLCNAYLVEAKWVASGQLPSSEEYLKNGLVSSGMHVAAMHIFYLLGQEINSKSIQHLNNFPDLVSSMAAILRLCNDLGGAKDENQNGYDGTSFIDCYENEHENDSIEISAEDNVRGLISEAWKRLNKTCLLSSSPFSADFTAACFNLSRLVSMMYSYDHDHRLPSLEKHMKSFLYETLD